MNSSLCTAKRTILWLCICCIFLPLFARAGEVRIATAADLQFAIKELASAFEKQHSTTKITVIIGSSGNFFAQIQAGAPFDMFFSADMLYPTELYKAGLTAAAPVLYGIGRLVLWTANASGINVQEGLTVLTNPAVKRIAMPNPDHAPYGKRGREALQYYKLWETVEKRIVPTENIAVAAQYTQSGNTQVGILSLAQATAPALKSVGTFFLIDEKSHQRLEQGYVLLKKSAANPEALAFQQFCASPQALQILAQFGFKIALQNQQPQQNR